MPDPKRLTIYLSAELCRQIQDRAEKNDRSVSREIVRLLAQAMAQEQQPE